MSEFSSKEWANLSVLVVEDQVDARNTLRSMLTEIGVSQILIAGDGKEALQFFEKGSDMVSIVICDWNMPNMTGAELLRQIRAANATVPFLMVTARADAESVIEAKQSGVTGYIRKPYSMSDLENKLERIMKMIKK